MVTLQDLAVDGRSQVFLLAQMVQIGAESTKQHSTQATAKSVAKAVIYASTILIVLSSFIRVGLSIYAIQATATEKNSLSLELSLMLLNVLPKKQAPRMVRALIGMVKVRGLIHQELLFPFEPAERLLVPNLPANVLSTPDNFRPPIQVSLGEDHEDPAGSIASGDKLDACDECFNPSLERYLATTDPESYDEISGQMEGPSCQRDIEGVQAQNGKVICDSEEGYLESTSDESSLGNSDDSRGGHITGSLYDAETASITTGSSWREGIVTGSEINRGGDVIYDSEKEESNAGLLFPNLEM